MSGKTYLTVEEVAARYRVSRWAVYGWIKEGRLPAVRIGTRYLFDADEVEQHLRTRAVKQSTAATAAG
jgi:excisionase family DNA binding protein